MQMHEDQRDEVQVQSVMAQRQEALRAAITRVIDRVNMLQTRLVTVLIPPVPTTGKQVPEEAGQCPLVEYFFEMEQLVNGLVEEVEEMTTRLQIG